ncbi:hypothetical protein RM553_01175 [Zunongwangia sp. F363]|uniref:Uncharacterized protein n=1 Tax=Autumnicola tepida TaxID=3075595 RepID=A0ABU3C534_9FLAO|nr:hypothetical protein [Zunongwangia sp. F363]MDT0641431.1 hypothetical protein [Zunongwangia sp. F363]
MMLNLFIEYNMHNLTEKDALQIIKNLNNHADNLSITQDTSDIPVNIVLYLL